MGCKDWESVDGHEQEWLKGYFIENTCIDYTDATNTQQNRVSKGSGGESKLELATGKGCYC